MKKPSSPITFRPANKDDLEDILDIIDFAIASRKADGSKQWQDGYPNRDTILNDLENKYAYVLTSGNEVMAYAAVIFDIEPAYEKIEGQWCSDQTYVVVHRIAVSAKAKGKGYAKKILQEIASLAVSNNVYSVRVDTNFDNYAMLHILEKLGYTACGKVYFRGEAREAFEKVLPKT